MKKIKTILYLMILSTFFKVGNVLWAFWVEKINNWLIWGSDNADIVIQEYTVYILWFLYLIAVLYWIYWWFKIITAAEDDDKVKSWKTIIIQSLIWIVIIFLAGPIVNLFLWTGWSDTGIIWE